MLMFAICLLVIAVLVVVAMYCLAPSAVVNELFVLVAQRVAAVVPRVSAAREHCLAVVRQVAREQSLHSPTRIVARVFGAVLNSVASMVAVVFSAMFMAPSLTDIGLLDAGLATSLMAMAGSALVWMLALNLAQAAARITDLFGFSYFMPVGGIHQRIAMGVMGVAAIGFVVAVEVTGVAHNASLLAQPADAGIAIAAGEALASGSEPGVTATPSSANAGMEQVRMLMVLAFVANLLMLAMTHDGLAVAGVLLGAALAGIAAGGLRVLEKVASVTARVLAGMDKAKRR